MEKQIILTGDRPTGCLHLGHYVGSLENRFLLQETHKQYIMIADVQALTDYYDRPKKIISSIMDVTKDYLSIGINPEKSTIFLQSSISGLFELTVYYMNMVTLARLERNPTVKTELAQKNMTTSIPVGFLCYPISQAADITAFKADLVPVGEDQLPLIEQCNEIVRKFNSLYNTNCLKEAKALLSNTPRLVGIDGKNKASKSLNNAIFLSDSKEVIKEKVFMMYTDPEHIKASDPGKVEGNVVFTYLDTFMHDKDELQNLKSKYQIGGVGDTAIKSLLNEILQELLAPIRHKREDLDEAEVMDVIADGTKRANLVACETVMQVREAIGVDFLGR